MIRQVFSEAILNISLEPNNQTQNWPHMCLLAQKPAECANQVSDFEKEDLFNFS